MLKKLGSIFLNLAEASQDIFWIRSIDFYTHVYVSPAFKNIFGISRQTLYANPNKWMNAVIIEDRDRLRHLIMEWQVKNKKGRLTRLIIELLMCMAKCTGSTKLVIPFMRTTNALVMRK